MIAQAEWTHRVASTTKKGRWSTAVSEDFSFLVYFIREAAKLFSQKNSEFSQNQILMNNTVQSTFAC